MKRRKTRIPTSQGTYSRIRTPFGETAFTNNKAEFDAIAAQQNGGLESEHRYGRVQDEYATSQFIDHDTEGAILGLKNGNAFIDGGLNVIGKDGVTRNFMCLIVYCSPDNKIYDKMNGYEGDDLYEYIDKIKAQNPKFRMDMTEFCGAPWDEKSEELFEYLAVRR